MFSREPAAGVKIPEHKVLLNEPVLDYVQVASAEGFLKGKIPGRVLQLPSLTRLGAGGVETLQNSPVMYEDFVGMRGDSRLAFGNLSDGFVSSTAFEKIEVSRQNWPAGMGSTPRNVSCNSASGYLGPRVKFMCSCGGKILPRPTDGKLRYVGGETRIISVNRHISYSDLMLKMAECYGQAMILKYQLPDEDLDALISVSSEEDLENMMEEYDRLDAGEGSPRLRVVLFSAAEYDANHLNDEGERRNSEQMYVDAVNGLLESGIRKPVDTGSAGSSQNLMGIDIPDAWYAFQKPDNVPVSLFGSPNPQDVVISVAPSLAPPKQAFPGSVLAPTSTLSSSPMSSQSFQTRHFPIPDIVPQSSPGLLGKVNGHQYAASRSDGSHQDPESGGSASSSMASQHDLPHSEFRMVPDSSIKAQHETMMPYGNHPDHMYQAEPWRVVEAVMPRVDSPGMMSGIDPPGRVLRTEPHAKLMRLREQHLEFTQPGLADKKLDNHFSGVLLPQVDLQGLASQQQQQQLTQSDLHHPLEAQPDSYRWADPVQQPFSDGSHAQQQVLHQEQVLHFYPPPAAVYKQAEEPQLHDVIPDGNMSYKPSSLETSGTQSAVGIASPDFQIGSSPSSQHLGFWCHTGELQGQQQLQGNQVSDGGFADQQYEWRLHLNNVQLSRAFLPSESVPQYCEQVMLVEDGLTCQQTPIPFVDPKQMLNSGDGKYEPLQAKNYHFDGLKRPALTQTVVDIYDEDAPESLQGHQEANGVPFPAEEHQSLSNDNVNAKLDYREPQQQPRIPTHPFSLERLTEEDGVLLERRKVFDNETAGLAFFSAPQVLEESNPFLIPFADDSHTKAQPQSDQHHDPLGNSSFGIRTGLLPPVTGMHSRAVSRAVVLDAAQAANLAGKSEAAPTTSQTGTEMPNLKIASAYEELPVRIPASNARDLSVAQRLLEERISGIVSTQAAPLVNSLMPSAGLSTSESFITADSIEGQWDGDFDLPGTELELIGYGQMAQFCEDPMDGKSGLVLNSELCRPASGGNVSMVEDAFDAGSKVDIHSTDCKSLIDDDTLVLPYAMQHHTQASGIATGSSFSVAMNILATKLGTLTLNKASAAQSSTAMASSTPSSFLVERSIPLSSASPVVGLSSHSAPTSISVSFLAEETKDKQETAVEKLGLASATTSEIPFSMTGKSEGKVVLDSALKKEPPANNRNQVNTSGQHACHDHEVDDVKGELKHVAENVAEAVLDSTPYSSATLSVQNWENSLAEAKLEPDTNENLPEEKSLDEVKLDAVTCKEVIFEETKVEKAVDDVPKIKKPSNLAADAVAEAINPGLQVIKNADLEELRELGSGTFGTVYHGKWRGTDVAIKRIKSSCFAGRPSERERLLADFWREARILGLLHHPNVVAFYGVVTDGPGGTLATVTEYMVNGSLKQVLQRKDRNCRTIDRRKRLVIAMDTAFGMEYLHGKKIVHFDLKCDNLLVNMRDPQRPICKVGDLGLSKVKEQTMVSGGVRGTLPWMAPELLNGSSSLVTDKVDVFSFGIVMWELLTGEEPYANMHYGAIIGGIVNNTLRPPIPSWCDPAWKSLMERCWSADPLERPNFQQIAAELRAMAASFHGRGQGQSHTTGQVQTQM